MKITVNPTVSNINLTPIKNMFQNMILNKLKEMVYPMKKRISIPLYKEDHGF